MRLKPGAAGECRLSTGRASLIAFGYALELEGFPRNGLSEKAVIPPSSTGLVFSFREPARTQGRSTVREGLPELGTAEDAPKPTGLSALAAAVDPLSLAKNFALVSSIDFSSDGNGVIAN